MPSLTRNSRQKLNSFSSSNYLQKDYTVVAGAPGRGGSALRESSSRTRPVCQDGHSAEWTQHLWGHLLPTSAALWLSKSGVPDAFSFVLL